MRRELKSLYEREEANEREIKRLKILDDYRVKETRERLAWLEQFKDSASYHIQQLRDQLINCVPQVHTSSNPRDNTYEYLAGCCLYKFPVILLEYSSNFSLINTAD